MLSVNTNGGDDRLQNLNKTNTEMMQTRGGRINTGLAVATAKDNGGMYAIAQAMRGIRRRPERRGSGSQSRQSIVDVALAGENHLGSDRADEGKGGGRRGPVAGHGQPDGPERGFRGAAQAIDSIVTNASFNNVNIINNTTTRLQTLASALGSLLTVLGEPVAGRIDRHDRLDQPDQTQTAASTMTATVSASLTNLNRALARPGTGAKRLELQGSSSPNCPTV